MSSMSQPLSKLKASIRRIPSLNRKSSVFAAALATTLLVGSAGANFLTSHQDKIAEKARDEVIDKLADHLREHTKDPSFKGDIDAFKALRDPIGSVLPLPLRAMYAALKPVELSDGVVQQFDGSAQKMMEREKPVPDPSAQLPTVQPVPGGPATTPSTVAAVPGGPAVGTPDAHDNTVERPTIDPGPAPDHSQTEMQVAGGPATEATAVEAVPGGPSPEGPGPDTGDGDEGGDEGDPD